MSLVDNVKENVDDLVDIALSTLQNTFSDAKEYFTNLDRDDLKQLLEELKSYVPDIKQEEFKQILKDIQSTIGENIDPDRLKEILQDANLNLENMDIDTKLNTVVEYVKDNYGSGLTTVLTTYSGCALQVNHYTIMLWHLGELFIYISTFIQS